MERCMCMTHQIDSNISLKLRGFRPHRLSHHPLLPNAIKKLSIVQLGRRDDFLSECLLIA